MIFMNLTLPRRCELSWSTATKQSSRRLRRLHVRVTAAGLRLSVRRGHGS